MRIMGLLSAGRLLLAAEMMQDGLGATILLV
jgi:hypothetical protein